jgi:hypothetical protein
MKPEIVVADGLTRRRNLLTLSEVAKCYRRPVSRQWVSKVERSKAISERARALYVDALRKAIADRQLIERVAQVVAAARPERRRKRRSSAGF